MNTQEPQVVKMANADPSALGLFGLAIVTLVACSQKLDWTTGTSLVIPWAIFLGGLVQLFACIHDAKRQNLFGTTAFGAYAFFWFGVAMSWLIQNGVFGAKMAESADAKQLGFAFVGYLVFTLIMTVAAVETNKVLLIIFILIDVLFIGLSMKSFNIAHDFAGQLAGWAELLIAIASFYGVAANVLNGHFGRTFLPVGKPAGIFKK